MLVDAAKYGDVEIPVFCYEPKLGQPVGACRMCLVEIEGIPKLQTGCSTPVKDGMVVHTQTERVHARPARGRRVPADQPPARLPGLRQGRRVPAAGHHLRLGPGHVALHRAQAPLPQAARAVAADRDRPRALHPLLPLRALLAGGLRGLPAGPVRARRAHATSRRSTGTRTSAPFSGNIIELCPVGALTSTRLPLPRAPVGHRGRRHDLHLLPVAVQRRADRARRPRDARARARPRGGRRRLAVRQGPLRLPVDAHRRAHHAAARARGRAADAGVVGEGARRRRGRAEEGGPEGGRAGRRRHDQRGGVPARAAVPRGARLRPRWPAARRARCRPSCRARSPTRRCRRRCPTSSSPTRCWCSTATRSTTRRSSTCASARACAATACGSPSRAPAPARSTPTPSRCCATRPAPARRCWSGSTPRSAATTATSAARPPPRARTPPPCAGSPTFLAGAGDDVVIVYGERLLSGPRGAEAAQALLNLAARLGLAGRDGAGLLEIPVGDERARHPRGRLRGRARAGLRRASSRPRRRGRRVRALPAARRPAAHHPDRAAWEAALGQRPDRDRARRPR